MSLACTCATPVHDRTCRHARTVAARAAIFAGLFDDARLEGQPGRLLNPGCGDSDPVTRRFSLVEID